MSNKKLAVLALLAPTLALAESRLTIYGIADLGVRHASGLSATNGASPGNAGLLANNVNNTSRLGFRGVEELGGGLQALFNLESGLQLDQGVNASSTKFFERASWVGLGGRFGTLTAGRQTTMLAEAISPVEPLGMRFSALNATIANAALSSHGLGTEYGAAGSTSGVFRLDNSVKYSHRIGPVTARVMHSFGETANHSAARSSSGIGAGYVAGNLTVTGAYQTFKSATELELDGATLGAAYKWGRFRLAANTARNKAETSSTASTEQRVHSVGGTFSVTPQIDLTGAFYRVDRERTGSGRDGFNRAIFFAEYKFSRRTRLYAEADYTDWRNGYQGAANKDTASGVTVGVIHTF